MRQLFETLYTHLRRKEAAVLVTIVASTGSTPRGAGARMLVCPDGKTQGTIGGGAVEYRALQRAKAAFSGKCSFLESFSLSNRNAAEIGMVCGGTVQVFFQYVDGTDSDMLRLCEEILSALDQNEDRWIVLDLTDPSRWTMKLCQQQDAELDMEGTARYVEQLVQAGLVYVFGGGHVAQELVPLLAHVGFRCVVMDDRPEFANREVFPAAEQTIVGNLERIGDQVQIGPQDYVCIMTRGHEFDYYVQRQALARNPRYIGVMGSCSKIRAVTDKLLEDGFSPEQIQSCHMPIGTAIHAQTPAEIAVSIAGELIWVRAGHGRR
ncbi:MAG: XdhC family protein [Lachnospiraceae bacterium]|nr:XdhC family protein [Lachnospiraceae bacterium]